MPVATAEAPAVAMSFANNFWGKDDAGVGPLLERMHGAKHTCDELKSFYSTRASIEEEYAKKLLNLTRKALGSQELGGLKISLDTVRGEVEAMAKQHQSIAAQMKTELEEPLAAFAGGMKERRKIVQNTVEKLLKIKVQQTQQVNKTRDRYEQDCLKIKGYMAQGHMVMGQEERRNRAKLEKTQISVATSNTEYEAAVKILEDTTARWNREWKAAADKFQDLEEERLDFTKSSLWTFANIASTVCVSDDASCEKIRLSLENMEVEKDINSFIVDKGTGQEIPDAPKYINFCRGDVGDNQSEMSEDENFSVAQFPRSINPAFRSSSPQPSTFESHHDPNSALANNLAHRDTAPSSSRESLSLQQPAEREIVLTPQQKQLRRSMEDQQAPRRSTESQRPRVSQSSQRSHDRNSYDRNHHGALVSEQAGAFRNSRESLPLQQQATPKNREHSRDLSLAQQPQHPSSIRRSIDEQHQARRSMEDQRQRVSQSSHRGYDGYQSNGMIVDHRPPPLVTNQIVQHPQQQSPSTMTRDIILPPQQRPAPLDRRQSSFMPRQQAAQPTSRESTYSPQQPSAIPTGRESSYDVQKQPGQMSGRESSYTPQKQQSQPSPRESTYMTHQPVVSSARDSSYAPQKQQALPMAVESSYVPPPQSVQKYAGSNKDSTYSTQKQPTASISKDTVSATQKQTLPIRQSLEEQPQSGRPTTATTQSYDAQQHGPVAVVPHDPYPMDGMTMLCRTGPPSDRNSQVSSNRPSSKDENSDYATSFSSMEPPSGKASPTKQTPAAATSPTKSVFKKKSGFFQNHSPFRRKSVKEAQSPVQAGRNTWHPSATTSAPTPTPAPAPSVQNNSSPARRPQTQHVEPVQPPKSVLPERTQSPEPIDANASMALGVGNNVLPVTTPDTHSRRGTEPAAKPDVQEDDPIAMALAELRTVTLGKQGSIRMSADHYHGIPTPAPAQAAAAASRSQSIPVPGSRDAAAANRGTPPPTYQPSQAQNTPPVSRLGVPPPACTSKAMKEATKKATSQARSIYGDNASIRGEPAPSVYGTSPSNRSVYGVPSRPPTRGGDVPRAVSPAANSARSVSPQPQKQGTSASRRMDSRPASPNTQAYGRGASPAPYTEQQRPQSSYYQSQSLQRNASPAPRRGSDQPHYRQPSPNPSTRGMSPAPYAEQQRPQSSYAPFAEQQRPQSSYSGKNMAVQLAPDPYGSQRSRHGRPDSRASGMYDGDSRHGVADPSRLYTPDGRPILHYARALYMYQAAIPEELGFAKGDYLCVLRHQDDGWWEAEVHNGDGRIGLVPSNYLQPC